MRLSCLLSLILLLLIAGALPSFGYAVLTHEAIIDSAWNDIKPVLLRRYPNATPEDLKKAHAYAYGGCIIQDMGYYPFGSHYFSDLTHYVRSGDFVINLLREAQDLNELSFALGALAHYSADNNGHPIAVNRAVPIEYPKLRAEFGHVVTYAEDPAAHLKTEFGFDVAEVAHGTYAAEDYHDFIGFKVAKELLERAFLDTYSLQLKDQFTSLDLALGTYRRTVSHIIPEATKVAWQLNQTDIVKAHPGMTKRKFLYNIRRSAYEKEWGDKYQRPGFFARFLAFLFRLIPKVGPFRSIDVKAPTAATETLFMESFNKTLTMYRNLLVEDRSGKLSLPNMDFDTGRPTRQGEYSLADKTYAKLVRDLAHDNFKHLTPELRQNIVAFYQEPKPPVSLSKKDRKKDAKAWQDTLVALGKLKAYEAPTAVPAGSNGVE